MHYIVLKQLNTENCGLFSFMGVLTGYIKDRQEGGRELSTFWHLLYNVFIE